MNINVGIVMCLVKILLGGSLYYMMELFARGHSHWSMFLLGGVCFLVCGIINSAYGDSIYTWQKMTLCMVAITVLEFVCGLIVNVRLGWHIWDYSGMPLNVMGQICVPYMLLWFVVSYPAIILNNLCDMI